VAQSAVQVYDRIEIAEAKPDVRRVTRQGGVRRCCARRFKAAPEGLAPGSPFGPNLRALVIYLRSAQGIPMARLSEALKDLFGLDISGGALINVRDAARPAFAAQTDRIKQRLVSGAALASDETGLRVGKANWRLWVFHRGDSAAFVAEARRSKAVVETFLGEWRPGLWLSDRLGGQIGWARREHQFRLAHLIRDVQYVVDRADRDFAPGLKGLFKRACALGRRRANLADSTLKTDLADLNRRRDRLLSLRPASAAGRKLQKTVRAIRGNLFVFMTNREIEATNNGSERALRPGAVYRKITNGFRSEWGAKFYADLRSVIETGRRRSTRAIDAIRLTLQGAPLPIPSRQTASGREQLRLSAR